MAEISLSLDWRTIGLFRPTCTSSYLRYPVFQPLQNVGLFSLARVVFGSVEWPGEVDLSYDTLYLESVPVELAQPVAG